MLRITDHAEQLIKHAPSWLYQAAVVQMRLQRWEDAARSLEAVIAHAGSGAAGQLALGVVYGELGRFDEAERALQLAAAAGAPEANLREALDRLDVLRDGG